MTDKRFLAVFLAAVHGVHRSGAGTQETSYYTALNNLLDSVGEALKPKVRCVTYLGRTLVGKLASAEYLLWPTVSKSCSVGR